MGGLESSQSTGWCLWRQLVVAVLNVLC